MSSNTFGVMFHHFYSDAHPKGQGAISGEELDELIKFLEKDFKILPANEYLERHNQGSLRDTDICLTFDDALLSQVDIAVPVLNSHGVQAFFFVYSSPFTGDPDPLELYRYFRTTEYESFEDFYLAFEREAVSHETAGRRVSIALEAFNPNQYLRDFPFYSHADKKFRFLRNEVFVGREYNQVMETLMHLRNFNSNAAASKLYMKEDDLRRLDHSGHVIGLHSNSHPTMFQTLSPSEQSFEYEMNQDFLARVLQRFPTTMSHPCGNYTDETLQILRTMGITLGFRSSRSVTTSRTVLEVPREDHSNLMNAMRAK